MTRQSTAPTPTLDAYRRLIDLGALRQERRRRMRWRWTIGVPAQPLRATFDRDRGRPECRAFPTGSGGGSTRRRSARLSTRLKVTGALFHTQGGLLVDEEARVLRPDGCAAAQPLCRWRNGVQHRRCRRVGLSPGRRPVHGAHSRLACRHRGRGSSGSAPTGSVTVGRLCNPADGRRFGRDEALTILGEKVKLHTERADSATQGMS